MKRPASPPVTGPPIADEGGAARLKDLAAACRAAGERKLAASLSRDSARTRLLRAIASCSPYLFGLCLADPARLARLLAADPDAALDAALDRARSACEAALSQADAMLALRLLKQEAALLAGLADLSGRWSVPAVTAALTRTADEPSPSRCASSCAAPPTPGGSPRRRRRSRARLRADRARHGQVRRLRAQLLLATSTSSSSTTASAAPARGRGARAFFVRLTRDLVQMLSERTGDGYVFRTDLRLRPDPGATRSPSRRTAALIYYESFGQNWERAALIKARACAGDIAAGEALPAPSSPPSSGASTSTIAAIADVHAMKRQIHAHRGFGESPSPATTSSSGAAASARSSSSCRPSS